jgi:peptidoglycan/xylan/chitin deacetylase (PgdA/CDA1 family)
MGILAAAFSCSDVKKVSVPESNTEKSNSGLVYDKLKKKIYLTFDDGPTVGSKRLYDFFLQEKIPVNLYLVGKHYDAMPMLKKYIDSFKSLNYVLLANHSYTHGWNDRYEAFYSHPPAVVDDYKKAQATLGITSNIARCAGRNVWRTSNINITDDKGPGTAMDSLYTLGYQFTGWDYTWPYNYKTFKNTKNTEQMLSRAKLYFDSSYTKVPGHAVVLGHDQQFADDEDFMQLQQFVAAIKNSNEYEFASMADYPGIIKPPLNK